MAVQVDYYTYTGTPDRMTTFQIFLKRTFEVSKLVRISLTVTGCSITQDDDYTITLDQIQILADLDPWALLDASSAPGDGPDTACQAKSYCRIISKLFYIGRMSAPLMLYRASKASTKLADLKRHHLRTLAATVTSLKKDGAKLIFLSPSLTPSQPTPFELDRISDGTTASGTEVRVR